MQARLRKRRLASKPLFQSLEARQLLSGVTFASELPLPQNVLGYRVDNADTGLNANETILTPDNINAGNFGKRLTTPVDGQVYAEPLYASSVDITVGSAQGSHNVVYVVTEHDSLYAIDADSGNVLWKASFIDPASGITTMPAGETGSGDITVEIGITATPVIDLAHNMIYVEAKTKEVHAGDPNAHYVHKLWAVDLGSGAATDTVIADTSFNGGYIYNSGPYTVGTGDGAISVGGQSRVYFNAMRQMDRPGLTLNNGTVYLAFASHGDNGPYHGWLLSYDAASLTLTGALNTTPNGGLGGIWQGGGIVSMDPQGFLYFETGNGTFNPNTIITDPSNPRFGFPADANYGDSFVKVGVDPTTSETNQNPNGWGLKVVDFFTPFNEQQLDGADTDLGSGGPVVLPDSVGSVAHPHLLVGGGKEGKIYLIDRENMGKFNAATDNVVQTQAGAVGGILSEPAFFNNHIYYTSSYGGPVRAFSISNGVLSANPTSQTPDGFGNLDGSPFISANGTTNGIVWSLERGSSQLRAYDANNLATELYTSAQAGGNRDQIVGVQKFSTPTVVNGRVFVGTANALLVFGPPQPPTSLPADPTGLTANARFATQIDLAWNDIATNEEFYVVERSLDGVNGWTQVGTTGVNISTFSDNTVSPLTQYFYRVHAHNLLGDSGFSNIADATTASAPPLGAGDGLLGQYFDNIDFTNLVVTRVDPTVNFDFGGGSPDPAIGADTFSVIWSGQVQAQFTETYTFFTTSDDGIRLLINGQAVIDSFVDQAPTTHTGTFNMIAGNAYAITIQYYENGGGAVAELQWSSPSTPQQVVPQSQLFSGVAPIAPDNLTAEAASGTQINLAWDDNSANESGFALERRDGAAGVFQQIKLLDPNTTSYIDAGLSPGIEYTYRVRATNFGSNSAPSNEATVTTPTPPATPSGAHTTFVSTNEIDLAWTDNATDETVYRVFRRKGSAGSYIIVATLPADATSFQDQGLAGGALVPGTFYDYHIQAGNLAGFSDFAGANTFTITVAPSAPSAVAGDSSVTLQWTAPTGADTYNIYRGTSAGNENAIPIATGIVGTSFVDSSVANGVTVFYRVTAVNVGGESARSSEVSAQPQSGDHTAPIVTVNARKTNDPTPSLTGTVDDPSAVINVAVNGQSRAATNNGNGTWTLADNVLAALPDGVYNVAATATDAANNVGSDATTNELTIDTVAPIVTVTPRATNDPTPSLTGTINDPAAAVVVTVNGQTRSATNLGNGNWSLPDNSLATLPDGVYNVSVTATDAANNVGSDATTNELTIDSAAPVVTVATLTTSDNTPALSGTVSADAVTVSVTVNGQTFAAQKNGTTWTLADNVLAALPDGTYNVSVTAADAATNSGSDATTGELTIDTVVSAVPPVVTVAPRTTGSRSPQLTGAVDDPAATIAVTVDGHTYPALNNGDGAWTLPAGTISPPLAFASFTVTAVATNAAGPGQPATATLIVQANKLTVTTADATASEVGPDTATFHVSRTGPLTDALVVALNYSGTATSGVDYVGMPASVTIPAGQSAVDLILTPINNPEAEASESVTLTIAASADYVVSIASSTATILDMPAVTVVATDASASEVGPDNGTFTFTRTGAVTKVLTVPFAISGTATAGVDYGALPLTVTFPKKARSVTLTVRPINNIEPESIETVVVTLQPDGQQYNAASASATVSIADRPFVSISAPDALAAESGSPATQTGSFVVTRTGSATKAMTVYFQRSGSASSTDVKLPTTIVIPAGLSSQILLVAPIDDAVGEETEDVILTLTPKASYNVANLPEDRRATVLILDNEPRVSIVALDAQASETTPAGGDNGLFRISRTGSIATKLVVQLARTGTATSSKDFTSLPTSVTIPAGASFVDLALLVHDDALAEAIESVTLTIKPASGYAPDSNASNDAATINILDNDSPAFASNVAAFGATSSSSAVDDPAHKRPHGKTVSQPQDKLLDVLELVARKIPVGPTG
jgi:fibronectin type 3 domain-containing protein